MNHHLPRSVANAAKVIVASKSIATEVIEHFGISEQNINIIPFGVRSVFFSESPVANNLPEALDGHPFMLFVNGADPRKNLADTVQAFALFAEKHKSEDWRLAVTGETSAMSEALQTQGVVALGYPTETELAQLYRSAQGLCYPSKYEGFGLPVIEALASGTTVLTSRTPTLLEFAGLPGVVTPDADSVDGLMSGMETLVSNKTKQEAAQNRVKAQLQFSWEKCVDRTVACYRELV